jgi:Uncharacterized alpha/beta hydrolase domain (DUF2235)
MPKRIAYCSDGTWQVPLSGTNVYKLYKAILQTSDQVAYYDDGVGADATGLNKVFGGAFATDFNQKILDGYTKIAHVYEPGDTIYLFGFSRGAYTVRCIGGMIANCGLPTGSFTDDCVTQAFAAYRDPVNRASLLAALGTCALGPATIQMIGVWDTVGSLGIPAIFGGIDVKDYGFLDTGLHPDIRSGYHCMSIDENRAQFPATLWTIPNPPNPNQFIEQVWFTGCHGDIGGGLQQGGPVDGGTRLCDITLGYIFQKAQAQGLALDPTVTSQFQYGTLPAKFALDAINPSWKATDGPVHWRPIDPKSNIANSVAIRAQYNPGEYTPNNLTIADGTLADTYTQIPLVDPTAM